MVTEAVSAGYYHSDWWGQDYPHIQILTIDDLLHGRAQVKMPPQFGTFKEAQRMQLKVAEQRELGSGRVRAAPSVSHCQEQAFKRCKVNQQRLIDTRDTPQVRPGLK